MLASCHVTLEHILRYADCQFGTGHRVSSLVYSDSAAIPFWYVRPLLNLVWTASPLQPATGLQPTELKHFVPGAFNEPLSESPAHACVRASTFYKSSLKQAVEKLGCASECRPISRAQTVARSADVVIES